MCDCESKAAGDAHSRLLIPDPSSRRASGSKCLAPASPAGSKEGSSLTSEEGSCIQQVASCVPTEPRDRSVHQHQTGAHLSEPESPAARRGCSDKDFPVTSIPKGPCSCGEVPNLGIGPWSHLRRRSWLGKDKINTFFLHHACPPSGPQKLCLTHSRRQITAHGMKPAVTSASHPVSSHSDDGAIAHAALSHCRVITHSTASTPRQRGHCRACAAARERVTDAH